MPVYKETLDEPVGVVHVKDVFKLLARQDPQAEARRPHADPAATTWCGAGAVRAAVDAGRRSC